MARLIARKEILERESTYQGWKFPRILNQLSTVQVIIITVTGRQRKQGDRILDLSASIIELSVPQNSELRVLSPIRMLEDSIP